MTYTDDLTKLAKRLKDGPGLGREADLDVLIAEEIAGVEPTVDANAALTPAEKHELMRGKELVREEGRRFAKANLKMPYPDFKRFFKGLYKTLDAAMNTASFAQLAGVAPEAMARIEQGELSAGAKPDQSLTAPIVVVMQYLNITVSLWITMLASALAIRDKAGLPAMERTTVFSDGLAGEQRANDDVSIIATWRTELIQALEKKGATDLID